MSLVNTESFFAYGTYNGNDAFDASTGGANQARTAYALNLARAGYPVYMPSNATADTSGGWVVRADPVDPSQHALYPSSAAGNVNLGVMAGFKKKLPITDKQIIVGFSVFIPTEYIPNTSSSTVPVLRINATVDTDAAWQAVGITPLASAKEVFRVCNDLSIRWGTDAAQTSRKLNVGVVNYMEFRIDPGSVSVWIDDTFVMQKSVSLLAQSVAFMFENNINAFAGGTNMSGNPGRWALSNMYFMVNDGVAPTVRLGPTTRVVGSRPDTDIDVRFVRPIAAPSNASVAAQDLVDAPPQALQSVNVNDFDTYSSAQAGDTIRSMAMVHAVAIKVLASNLEPDPHKIKPYARYSNSGEGADAKTRELSIISGTGMTRTIRAMVLRPTDGKVWAVGDAQSVWVSGVSENITTWTRLQDLSNAVIYTGIYYDAQTGELLLARNDGKVDYVANGTDVITASTVAAISAALSPIAWVRSPDNSRYIGPSGLTTANQAYVLAGRPATTNMTGTNIGLPVGSAVGSGFSKILTANSVTMGVMAGAVDYVYTATGAASNTAAWTVRLHGVTATAFSALTYDGVAWLLASDSNNAGVGGGPLMRRSTDNGSTWSAVTALGSNNAGANTTLRFGCSNRTNQESIFGGDSGSLVASLNGIDWRQLPRLTAQALYDGVSLSNGDFIFGGANGTMLKYALPGTDTTLIPLAGYTMAFGSTSINPKTGAPWTAAEAADSYFGVRLTT